MHEKSQIASCIHLEYGSLTLENLKMQPGAVLLEDRRTQPLHWAAETSGCARDVNDLNLMPHAYTLLQYAISAPAPFCSYAPNNQPILYPKVD